MRILGDFRSPKVARATNSQAGGSAGRVQGGCREGAGRVRGGCREGARKQVAIGNVPRDIKKKKRRQQEAKKKMMI